MKKLLVMALGMGLVLGAVSFAQDTTSGSKMDDSKTSTKKAKKTKKTKKPATDATTTDKKM